MPNDRQLTLHSPTLAGDQALLVRRIEGREGLSQLFTYDVILYARSENVDFSKVLGHEMCIGLELPEGGERYFHGYVASFGNDGSDGEFTIYRAELKPHLWRLTRGTNCRIFQGETVPEIVEGILKEYGIDVEANYGGSNRTEYLPWSYCVQYRETDFAFVSRLLEHEGIHYFFRHEKDKHVLVLADSNVHHVPVSGYEQIEYTRAFNQENRRNECLWDWRVTSSVMPDKVTLTDYDFREPRKSLVGESGSEVEREHGTATPNVYEVYDHLETVVQQDGYSPQLSADYARMRSEEMHVRYAVISAQTDARGLCAGATFKVQHGPDATKKSEYIVLRSELSAEMDVRSSSAGGGSSGPVYRCWFEALDKKHPYRPPRATPKPFIPGPQSAIVAGPPGSKDIATDEWGRVYLKFHWARKVKEGDKDLSCWVRVSQNSAGANWGSMFVPHIGQEVLVGFIEGDPDRPVVIGRVYNGMNRPPLTLPDYKYKSIIRDEFGNEIIFDGTPGAEHMVFHTPSHDSVLMLGKSEKSVTKSDRVSASLNKSTYALGNNDSYTRGNSFTLKKGRSTTVELGQKISITAGAEFKASASSSFEIKAGVYTTFALNATLSWGWSTEYKRTKGGYTRQSSKDIVIDSGTKTIVSGGANDYSMLESTDKEIALSFDKSAAARKGALDAADAQMKGLAGVFMANAVAFSGTGKWSYDMAKYQAAKHVDGKIPEMVEADIDEFIGFSAGDIATGTAAASSLIGGLLPAKISVPVPSHPTPSAKISLSEDVLTLFAGKGRQSTITLKKDDGIDAKADGLLKLSSTKNGVEITAKADITLKSSTAVTVDSLLKHRNMVVMK